MPETTVVLGEHIPQGFSFAGVHCGLKRQVSKQDLALIVSDRDCSAAGVYTQNQVVAAPVILDRQRTPSRKIRAVAINSGNANACTGQRGVEDAGRMAAIAASALGLDPSQVLVLSTGIIGEHLPMQKIETGIHQAAQQLDSNIDAVLAAARGMMTTDTRHKLVSRNVDCHGRSVSILGLAKGAAMIGPHMATMLAVVVTDALLTPEVAQRLLSRAVDDSFNCISVEGHMSTNDTVFLLSNGAVGGNALAGDELNVFGEALNEACLALAKMIPDDGEGATHLIEISVEGCRSRQDASQIARAIANSPLVKTSIAGADPNWGRIVSAAGYAGVPFDPVTAQLNVNGILLYQHGSPLGFDAKAVSESIRKNRITRIQFALAQGDQAIRVWTCDLTAEYVHLNADYHT
jgi:glutamate N-acetyltransferase/amino-acid N-acetyltransferase